MAYPKILEEIGKVKGLTTDSKQIVGAINEHEEQINVLKGKWAGIYLLNGWRSAWEGVEPVYSINGNILTVKGMIIGGATEQGTPIFALPKNAIKLHNIEVQKWDSQERVFGIAAGGYFCVAYSSIKWSNTDYYLLDLEIILEGGEQI